MAVIAVLITGSAAAGAQAPASDAYPLRPVRFIAPFAPGGSTDTVARILAQRLGEGFGQNVIVDNRPGAGGTLGADMVVRAAPDGYTLLVGDFGPNAVAHALFAKLPYDPVKSFTHVSLAVTFPLVLVVPASTPIGALKDYIEQARQRPGMIRYGSAGVGTSPHIFMELLHSIAKVQTVHVPYKGGAPALSGLLAAEVDSALIAVSTALAQIGTGRVRALAVTSAAASPRLPNVPPVSSVVPGYEGLNFHGLHAPAGTPRAVVNRIAAEVAKAVARPDTRERLDALAMDVAGTRPEEFDAFIRRQVERWGTFARAAGVRAE